MGQTEQNTSAKQFLDFEGLNALWNTICSIFPAADGQGATGTWNIDISGTANHASSADTVDWSGVQNKPDFSLGSHDHDDRYYTKDYIDRNCMGLEDTGEEIEDVDYELIVQQRIGQYVTNEINAAVLNEINGTL